MAIRPVVLVYQDLATPTVTPTDPDLNCLIVGPAYHIRDYFKPDTTTYADKTDIRLGVDYGVLEGNPATALPSGSGVIVVAAPPDNAVGALLDDASVEIWMDEARALINTAATGLTSASTPNILTGTGTTWTTTVLPGDRVTISDGSAWISRTVKRVIDNTHIEWTADLPPSGYTPAGGQTYRITRQVNDVEIDASFFTINGQTVTINGSVVVSVTGNGDCLVVYAKVYMAYRSLRQDLPEVDTVEKTADIESKIGRIDGRNPLAVGAFVALQNTTSIVQFAAVTSDDLIGHTDVRDKLSGRPDIYAIIPMTTEVTIFAMWNSDCVGLALPDEDEGRPQRFRVVIGCGELTIDKTLIVPSTTGEPTQLASSTPGAVTKITLTGVASLVTGGVIPTDILRVTVTSAAGTVALADYVIASVTSATILEVETPFASAGTCDITCQIFESDGVTSRIASAPLTGVITAVEDDLYLILKDSSATFIASGVAPGDRIEMPANPNATINDNITVTLIVEEVISDQRLRIVNNGADTSLVQNELPFGVKRIGGALVSMTTVNYQIVRALNKTQQVTELVALAQSFNSRRTILVWPDKVDVAGVPNGTSQPGYYLGAAVGGMTAGLPSQQGFTNLGIAGISQIYFSNTYFSDAQLTDLSNGGWYVFAQQTPSSLPYTIHQLTTDPSTLESGEFSVVKNFDFVSMFFVDIVEDFLGQYNVNEDTVTLVQGALSNGGELLKLRTIAKIGAPLTSFGITEIGVSPLSGDRLVAYLAVGLPKPLNVMELHIVG